MSHLKSTQEDLHSLRQKAFGQQILEHIPGILYQLQITEDQQIDIRYLSRSVEQLGIAVEDMLADAAVFTKHIHPEDLQNVLSGTLFCARTLSTCKTRFRWMHPDGSERWIFAHDNAHRLPDQTIALTGYLQDITQQVHLEQAVSKKAALHELIASIAQRFLETDSDAFDQTVDNVLEKIGLFLEVDRTFLFQFSEDLTHASNTHEWCAEGIAPSKQFLQAYPIEKVPYLKELVQKRETFYIPDVDAMPDAMHAEREELRRFMVKSVLILPLIKENRILGYLGFDTVRHHRNLDKSVVSMLELMANIFSSALGGFHTNRRLHEAIHQAEVANEAKSTFLAKMSHELRTPLHGVIGFTELLSETALSDEQQEYAGYALRSAQTLHEIIDDILDFAKIEAGKLAIEPTYTDLAELILTTANVVRAPAKKKGINLRVVTSEHLSRHVLLDAKHLKQILLNLLGNAVKFTDQGEVMMQVTCKATLGGQAGRFEFVVSDTGIGIGADDLPYIFDPFMQAGDPTGNRRGGTGLGLPISQLLAQKMGSHIHCESTPEQGSTFRFALEALCEIPDDEVQDHASLDPNDQNRQNASSNLQPRILIAEDSSVNLRLMKQILKALYPHAEIYEARSGNEALKIWSKYSLDLIIMDVQMPDTDGILATRSIREQESAQKETKRVPVLAVTAGATTDMKEKCLSAGMSDFITKPIQLTAFRNTLQQWIHQNPGS